MESENDKLDEEQTAEGAPEFNDADSSSKEVYAFYNHWTKFVTKMSFSWEDKYNPKDVPNRQVRRAIEKENKKFRDIEKKKYNDIVRQLAAYIRKRDPRVVKFEVQARIKKEDEDRKKLETKLEAELRRKEKRELSRIALENNGEEVMRRAEERVGAFLLADYESDDDDNDLNLAEDDIEDIKAQADYASLNVVESTPLEENDYDRYIYIYEYTLLFVNICKYVFKYVHIFIFIYIYIFICILIMTMIAEEVKGRKQSYVKYAVKISKRKPSYCNI
jgi:hypothetical protein